jgi:hypothetical protein
MMSVLISALLGIAGCQRLRIDRMSEALRITRCFFRAISLFFLPAFPIEQQIPIISCPPFSSFEGYL